LFERIEYIFRRLEIYINIPMTARMTDMIVKVMTEVLSITAIVTKKISQNPAGEFIYRDGFGLSVYLLSEKVLKRLVRKDNDIQKALSRLDKVTTEETRIVAAEALTTLHGVGDKVTGVDQNVLCIQSTLNAMEARMRGLEDMLKDIRDKVLNSTNIICD
jgi:hypothetical protein